MDSIENKLDEDFLFYLGFVSSYSDRIKPETDVAKCKTWLIKLCGETYTTKEQKRYRNIFLSNLVLCMQNGGLVEPFNLPPHEVDISDCIKYFGDPQVELEDHGWIHEVAESPESNEPTREDGRTYVATRSMPGGQGAMAYIAVTLADVEPRWIGGGENILQRQMAEKYRQMVPEPTEMEKILARRKDPNERRKVITFYEVVIKNINEELDGNLHAANNETVNVLLEQLIHELHTTNTSEYDQYMSMPERQRRQELLLLLFDRCKSRIDKITKREEVLDDIKDRVLPKSFFETSMKAEDKFELPSLMWEQAINKAPSKKNMEKLLENYPRFIVEKFVQFLTNQKEEIAMLLQKRHERIVSQMKKELRKEGAGGAKKVEDAVKACDHAVEIMKDVLNAREAHLKSRIAFDEARRKAGRTKKSDLYEEMRKTVVQTQENVEAEASKGWELTEAINKAIEENEIYQQSNEETILKTEEANMQIMKNIKRLRAAVKTYEGTVKHIQDMILASTRGEAQTQFLM